MGGAVAFVGDSLSMKAAADLSAKQFRFVKMSADGTVTFAAASTDPIIGILQNKPNAAGKAALVKVMGGSKLKVDATTDVAAGDKLTSGTYGKGAVTTTDTHHVGAIALEAATLAGAGDDEVGEVISVLITNFTFAG